MKTEESTSLCDIKYKIVFLGDMGVGKTSIIERFVRDQFENQNNPTIGIDFLCRNLTYNKRTYRLQLWDTAGQQKYKSLVPAYLKDAHCAVFVVDITRPETLTNLQGWLQLFRENERKQSQAILMTNKSDLENRRMISSDVLANFAKKQGLFYWKVSAKTGEGVNECFTSIIKQLSQNNKNNEIEQDEIFELNQKFYYEYQKLKNKHTNQLLSCCYI